MRFRDLENLIRYRRVVKNPWQAATARSRGEQGQRLPLQLRRGGQLWIRSQTSDIRVFSDVFVKDVYRLSSLEARCRLRGQFDCIVDVGGHIGIFSTRVAGFTHRVIACEPMPENAALFRQNMESSACTNVQLVECAVSSSVGPLTLFTSRNTAGHTTLRSMSDQEAHSERVQATTLVSVLDDFDVKHCDLLKIDCEGGEYDMLFHADEATLRRIERIAMEYHNVGSKDPRNTGEELEHYLDAHGFTVERIASRRHSNYGILFAWRGSAWS